MPAAPTSWTTRALLAWMRDRFESEGLEPARVIAEMLLAHVLQCDRMRLYMDADREATEAERETLRPLVRRALQHEPVQYLVGTTWFYALEFETTNATLIPQPCTEDLVALALDVLPKRSRARGASAVAEQFDRTLDAVFADEDDTLPVIDVNVDDRAAAATSTNAATNPARGTARRVLDLGTGSGCIAIALAKHTPDDVTFTITDIVSAALDLARRNADRHAVTGRLDARTGSLYDPVTGETFDVIVSNPPYIPDHEWTDDSAMDRSVRDHVPASALRGGADGLEFIRPIFAQARDHLTPGGTIIVEVAASTAEHAAQCARDAGLHDVRVVNDSEGFARFVTGTARG